MDINMFQAIYCAKLKNILQDGMSQVTLEHKR